MTELTLRTKDELETVKGYSQKKEDIIQNLHLNDCPLSGYFLLQYEQQLLNIARISEDYSGGEWKISQGIWLLQSDSSYKVGNPNSYTIEELDAKSFSVFCSIAALNALTWLYHSKGMNELMNLAIYAYHRSFTQLDYEANLKVEIIRSLLD